MTPVATESVEPRAPGRPRRPRRLVLVAASILVGLLAGEAIDRAWLALRGTPYREAQTAAAIRRAAGGMSRGAPTGEDPGSWPGGEGKTPGRGAVGPTVRHVLHPYLGFDIEDGSRMIARELARQKHRPPREYTIAIIGGSVAAGFASMGPRRLAEILEASSLLSGRSVRVVNLGRGGFKQPQQLILIGHLLGLGFRPHAVINVDGFNEVALGNYNAAHRVNPVFPSASHWLLKEGSATANPEGLDALLAMRSSEQAARRVAHAALAWGLCRSAVLGGLVRARVERLHAAWSQAQERFVAAATGRSLPPALRGPPFPKGVEAGLRVAVRDWLECSLSLDVLCRSRSITYLHVLQPTLHDDGAKPLTPREVAASGAHPTWIEGARRGYPMLRAASARLTEQGVAFLDASRIFSEVRESLYVDACHFAARGNEILAESVARALLDAMAGSASPPGQGREEPGHRGEED